MLKAGCRIGLFRSRVRPAASAAGRSRRAAWCPAGRAGRRRAAYDADNLFEYMDGNSEGYLLYGFQNMHGVTCTQGRRHAS